MKSLIHAPLFKLALFVLGGIYLSASWTGDLAWVGLPAGLAFGYCVWQDRRYRSRGFERMVALLIGLVGLGLGASRYQVAQIEAPGLPVAHLNCEQVFLIATVSGPVKTTPYGRKTHLQVHVAQRDSQLLLTRGGLLAYLPESLDTVALAQYDTVYLQAYIQDLRTPYPGYRVYLERQGITHVAKVKLLERGAPGQSLKAFAYRTQQALGQQLQTLVPDTAVQGIALAMFLGEKSQLAPETREAFAAAGLSHILAISGMHVGIIFLFLNTLFSPLIFLPRGHQLKHLLVLLALLAYMLLTGAAPAVVRAVLMFGTVLVFRITYHRYHMLNLLAISALLQLAYDPMIAFEVGFQLSYAAVLGIVLLYPWFQRLCPGSPGWLKMIYGWMGVTLTATLATAPLVWSYFGQFPTYFLAANLLASALVTLVVFVGFFTVIFSYLPGVNAVLGGLCEMLLQGLHILVTEVASLPGAVMTSLRWDQPAWGWILWQLAGAALLLAFPRLLQWLSHLKLPKARAFPQALPQNE